MNFVRSTKIENMIPFSMWLLSIKNISKVWNVFFRCKQLNKHVIICIYLKRLFIRFIAYTCVKYFEIQFHFGLNGQLFEHSITYICSIILASVRPLMMPQLTINIKNILD